MAVVRFSDQHELMVCRINPALPNFHFLITESEYKYRLLADRIIQTSADYCLPVFWWKSSSSLQHMPVPQPFIPLGASGILLKQCASRVPRDYSLRMLQIIGAGRRGSNLFCLAPPDQHDPFFGALNIAQSFFILLSLWAPVTVHSPLPLNP